MTLNKTQTALLNVALNCKANLFYWLQNDTINVSNNEHSGIKSDFESWKDAYENEGLYGTKPDDTTFEFSGITQFPIPPSR